jgi:hypothetical protein
MPGFGIRSISLSLDNMPGEDQNKTNDGVMLMCMYRGESGYCSPPSVGLLKTFGVTVSGCR